MRASALLCSLALCIGGTAAHAALFDGNQLEEGIAATDRVMAGTADDIDFLNGAQMSGYVAGVSDAEEGVLVCYPTPVTHRQVMALVKRRLREHHEEWNGPANVIVTKALSTAFPCKKRK